MQKRRTGEFVFHGSSRSSVYERYGRGTARTKSGNRVGKENNFEERTEGGHSGLESKKSSVGLLKSNSSKAFQRVKEICFKKRQPQETQEQ